MTNLLEILYATEFKKPSFYPRKFSFSEAKTLLVGPKKSGKSTLIFDYLSTKKKGSFLYIDFADLRLSQAIIFGLPAFIEHHDITLLVLENFDFSFKIPDCQEVIITTCAHKTLEGFSTQVLYPLDFEEFIAFAKKGSDAETIFGHFANVGTFPAMLEVSKFAFVQSFQHLLTSYYHAPVELEILKTYTLRQSTLVSVYAMFNLVKKHHKISKDKFYAYTAKLLNEEVIFMVEKYGQKSTQKKLYMIDFAMRGVLSFEKDFIRRFENMIFLELYKRGMEVNYTDVIDFYLPQKDTAIFSLPFVPRETIGKRLQKAYGEFEKLGIRQVQVITMGLEDEMYTGDIAVELLPFWNWAVQL